MFLTHGFASTWFAMVWLSVTAVPDRQWCRSSLVQEFMYATQQHRCHALYVLLVAVIGESCLGSVPSGAVLKPYTR